ncbi:hypothetical protein FACS1894151_06710 [Spirochaetia bacterium]|nr:hypothetical protein FACS1894151_06710 [Spirochaetia bacterium]
MKSLTIVLIYCFLLCGIGVGINAGEPLTYVQAPMGERFPDYSRIKSKYGEIWIGYSAVSNIRFVTGIGRNLFVIDTAYYYYKRGNEYVLLGSFDKDGLYDKNGIRLQGQPRVPSDAKVIGLSSTMLNTPFIPGLVLQTNTMIYETDPVISIGFDFEQDSLKVWMPDLR